MARPWFKPKRFGSGWNPSSWEGWAIVGAVVMFSVVVDRIA